MRARWAFESVGCGQQPALPEQVGTGPPRAKEDREERFAVLA